MLKLNDIDIFNNKTIKNSTFINQYPISDTQ